MLEKSGLSFQLCFDSPFWEALCLAGNVTAATTHSGCPFLYSSSKVRSLLLTGLNVVTFWNHSGADCAGLWHRPIPGGTWRSRPPNLRRAELSEDRKMPGHEGRRQEGCWAGPVLLLQSHVPPKPGHLLSCPVCVGRAGRGEGSWDSHREPPRTGTWEGGGQRTPGPAKC